MTMGQVEADRLEAEGHALIARGHDLLARAAAERAISPQADLTRAFENIVVGDFYTTSKIGPPIPGKTRRWMRRHVPTIPGATKIGRDWVIPREALDDWVAARAKHQAHARGPKKVAAAPLLDDEALAEEALRNAGYRTNARRG
jgi:hypothetical protein